MVRQCSVSVELDPIEDSNGDLLYYPGNDRSVAPSARMPKGGFYFDQSIRQEPIDEDAPDVSGNLADFRVLADSLVADVAHEAEHSTHTRTTASSSGSPTHGSVIRRRCQDPA